MCNEVCLKNNNINAIQCLLDLLQYKLCDKTKSRYGVFSDKKMSEYLEAEM